MQPDRSRPDPDGPAAVTVWFLEAHPSASPPARPTPEGFRLRRVARPEVADFRRLYDAVGSAYDWTDMHRLGPAELRAFVTDSRVELHLLTDVKEQEAGFFQLDLRSLARDGSGDIAYFGLLPGFCGRGLGPWLLRAAMNRAACAGVRRLTVNTCSLDHPAALRTYRRAGFRVIRQEKRPRQPASLPWRTEQPNHEGQPSNSQPSRPSGGVPPCRG